MIVRYSWDGKTWTRESGQGFPAGALAADPATGKVIGYSGAEAGCIPDPCQGAVSRTMIGDGLTFVLLAGPEPEPDPGNLVSDPIDGGVLLLNEMGHTWVRSQDAWQERATSGPDLSIPGFLYTDGRGVYTSLSLGSPLHGGAGTGPSGVGPRGSPPPTPGPPTVDAVKPKTKLRTWFDHATQANADQARSMERSRVLETARRQAPTPLFADDMLSRSMREPSRMLRA